MRQKAASFPVHLARQPTPVELPSAACYLPDCSRWSRPRPSSPSSSGPPAIPSTWSGARFATPSWPATDQPLDHDLDFTTDARPDDIEAIVSGWADAVWTQGKRFGTIGSKRGELTYEITTHRAEAYHPDSRKPEVAFGDKVEDDLSRRDFTVNAMALRLPEMELIDPFNGLADLAARRLRTPLDPEVSFADDPLRMLRAARFIARLGLEPTPELVEAVKAGHGRLSIVSAERIRDELDKMVVVPVPSVALWFVVRTGLASEFLPELPGLALEQDPIHRHKDVLAHTLAVMDKTSPDRMLRLAALFHNVGKPKTRAFGDGGVTFHHHEVVGARMTRERMTALRYPKAEVIESAPGGAEVIAVLGVVALEPARADSEDEPAVADVIDGAGHVGQQFGIAVAVARHQGADLDA